MKRAVSTDAEQRNGVRAASPDGRSAGRSFRRRLAIRMTLLCVSILVASLLAVFFAVQQSLWLNLDRMLASIARSEMASSMDGPQGRVHTHDVSSIPLNLKVGDGYEKFVQIMDRDGTIVAHTRNVPENGGLKIDETAANIAWTQGSSLGNVWRNDDRFRGLYYRLQDREGKQFVAVLALPREPVLHLLRSLAFVLVGTLLVAGAASAFLSFRLAAYLTRPLRRIADAASSVQEADLTVRIPSVSRDAEFQDVTKGLNEMLQRLESAFTMRQQTLESQQRFTADASHELRTPLTNLQGHLEVALRHPRSTEAYRETITVALSETKRMARLVSDLLTLSRADADLLRLRPRPCNLADIANESVRAFLHRAEAVQIGLLVDGPREVMVTVDPDRLRQVIENLLDNAMRHAPSGSTITLSLSQQPGEARLSVIDRGLGLTPDEQAHVFERFYRTDPSRTTDTGGTGLGLSIAKAIMEAHGGSIAVESEPGKATAFTIRLKQKAAEQGAAKSPALMTH